MRRLTFGFMSAAFCLTALSAQAAPTDVSWRIRKDRWSETDEKKFAEFVQALGESRCRTTDDCLKSPANPYRTSDPQDKKFFSDCADFPYVMRAYFAWKNNLPFGFVSDVASVEGGSDIRYTPKGNRVTGRSEVTARANGQFPNALKVLSTVSDVISSAMFRFNPKMDDAVLFTDHYSVQITRGPIRPGTVIYDPNGHVAMVYKIENDGRILFMDAHPDNSITRGTYGKKFARSNPGMGAGFKNWRPVQLTGYTRDENGNLLGGKLTGIRNKDLPDYSLDQYFGNAPSADGNWKSGAFVINQEKVDYYDFVRQSLAAGELRYEPLTELKNMLDALCQDAKDRAISVQLAISHGIDKKGHPGRLPTNIYGTSGEWEEFSTPSRDARLKTSFKEARDRVAEFVELQRQGSPKLNYTGKDIKKDLLKVYQDTAQACVIEYTQSNGKAKALNLDEVIDRLFLLSFDPYHCVERRWGATEPSELSSCSEDSDKRRWYEGEQMLRNQIDRTYDTRMDFSLQEVSTPRPGNGVQNAPDVDIKKFLSSPN